MRSILVSRARPVFFLALLAGCTTIPVYELPPQGARSNLVLDRENTQGISMVFYSNGYSCTAQRTFPGGDKPFWDGKPLVLESGKEFAFRFRGLATVADMTQTAPINCPAVIFSFKPEPGRNYRVRYITNAVQGQCATTLVRTNVAGEGIGEANEPSFRIRVARKQESANDSACEP